MRIFKQSCSHYFSADLIFFCDSVGNSAAFESMTIPFILLESSTVPNDIPQSNRRVNDMCRKESISLSFAEGLES